MFLKRAYEVRNNHSFCVVTPKFTQQHPVLLHQLRPEAVKEQVEFGDSCAYPRSRKWPVVKTDRSLRVSAKMWILDVRDSDLYLIRYLEEVYSTCPSGGHVHAAAP